LETADRQSGNKKNVLCKHLEGKTLFTGMLRVYAPIHTEMKDTLLTDNTQGEEDVAPQSRRRKRNSDPDDDSTNSKKEATEKCRPLTVY
jgi:hypothetical protein